MDAREQQKLYDGTLLPQRSSFWQREQQRSVVGNCRPHAISHALQDMTKIAKLRLDASTAALTTWEPAAQAIPMLPRNSRLFQRTRKNTRIRPPSGQRAKKKSKERSQDTRPQPSQSKRKHHTTWCVEFLGTPMWQMPYWTELCVFPRALITATPRQAELGPHLSTSAVLGDTTYCAAQLTPPTESPPFSLALAAAAAAQA